MTVWITRYVYLHQVTALAFATTYVTHTISHRVMTLKELTNGLQQVFLSLIQFKDKNASGKSFVRIHFRADSQVFSERLSTRTDKNNQATKNLYLSISDCILTFLCNWILTV